MKMIQRLQLLEHLTPTEQILVDYLKENSEEFIGLKPREVSDKLFISVSTIYRLINKLGLRGVNDLNYFCEQTSNKAKITKFQMLIFQF